MSVYCGTIVKSDKGPKRVPKNPKYAHIRGVVDTGDSMSKVKVVSMREYIKRKSEIFRRISPSKLNDVLTEGDAEPAASGATDEGKKASKHDDDTDDEEMKEKEKNYVIIDLRPTENFEACHIAGAINFPANHLRADKTAGLYKYKSRMRRDKKFLFIVYDNDERIAVPAASTFVEKGWEGTVMLTKGLSHFSERFPDHIIGDPPVPDTPRSTMSTSRTSRRGRRRHRRRP